MIKAILAVALIFSSVNCSSLIETKEANDRATAPSPRSAKFYNMKTIKVPGPPDLQRNVSYEMLAPSNYPKQAYDEKSFFPLAITDTSAICQTFFESEQDKLQIENRVRGILRKFNIEDGGLVAKSLTTFILAIIILFVYNGLYLKFF